jgi:hypothetical protein
VKKYILIIILYFLFSKNVYGISENFKFVIDTIGIPRYNVYSKEINEDIYYTYNIFSYGSPNDLIYNSNQRFKEVPNQGKWTRYDGKYIGQSARGEYYLLGTNYNGNIISNVYFPVDSFPETSPENWNFISTSGAYDSWFDRSKYKYEEQLDFMKNTKLLFDKLDFTNRVTDPYNLVEYNIIINNKGLDKFTLDTPSTWKTNGIVTARRLNNKGQIRHAIFATNKMAASADITPTLKVDNVYTLEKNKDEMNFIVNFGSLATNLNYYANKKHIKDITAILYINNVEVSRTNGSKTLNVSSDYVQTIKRENYNKPYVYPIDIKVKSYLYTEFSVDGLIQKEFNKRILLNIIKKEVNPVKDVSLSTLEKNNETLVVRPLISTNVTSESNSQGITEIGKYIAIKINCANNIEVIDLKLNNNKIEFEKIIDLSNKKVLKIKIDNYVSSTLKSWNYIRDFNKNYFSIDFDEIGSRIKKPNELKILVNNTYEKLLYFDTMDSYNNNFNFTFNNDVINKENFK